MADAAAGPGGAGAILTRNRRGPKAGQKSRRAAVANEMSGVAARSGEARQAQRASSASSARSGIPLSRSAATVRVT